MIRMFLRLQKRSSITDRINNKIFRLVVSVKIICLIENERKIESVCFRRFLE